MRPVWWIVTTALAQEAPPNPVDPPPPLDGPVETLPVVLPPPPPEPPPFVPLLSDWRTGFEWVAVGPPGVSSLTSVAAAVEPGLWAAAGNDGAVWVTDDAGKTWSRVLDPYLLGSNDEAILREVEARLGEIGGDLDTSEFIAPDDLQQIVEDAQQTTQQVVDEIQSELDAGPWFLEQQAALAGDLDAAHPRVWFTSDGRLVVGRADGLRVAERTGSGWAPRSAWADPVTAFTELPDHTFLVGLTDGLLRGTRDLRDFEPLPVLDGVRVTDLLVDGGLYASTAQGVWWTAEGLAWTHLPATTGVVYATVPSRRTPDAVAPALELPVVLGTDATMLRALRPRDESGRAVPGGPMPGVSAFSRRLDGGILAASLAGPWWSDDGGATWADLSLGEDSVRSARDAEIVGDTALLATAAGLFRLRVREVLPEARVPDWVPLGALVDASLGRPELTAHVGSRWVAATLPDVSWDYGWQQAVFDRWDADFWTVRDVDTSWMTRVVLTWRPGRQRTSSTFDVLDPGANLSVLVVDGQAVIDDGTSGAVMASAVRRGATQYRDELAENIGQLWRERQRLVAEGMPPGASLPDRVRQALRIQEIEARLDALSDGAVSDWDPGDPATGSRKRGG